MREVSHFTSSSFVPVSLDKLQSPMCGPNSGMVAEPARAGLMGGSKPTAEIDVQLPDEILAREIFSRVPLRALLEIRSTCKQWNRVIMSDSRIPEGTDLRRCLVQRFHRAEWRFQGGQDDCCALAHKPVQDEWYPGPIPWAETLKLDGFQSVVFVEADGPFLLHYAKRNRADADGRYIVHNPLTKKHHFLPPDPQPDRSKKKVHLHRTVKLIPGLAADADVAGGGGSANYRAVMVTVIVSTGAKTNGWFYTHLYSRVTNQWRFVSCVDMRDKELWPRTKHWRVTGECFDGRFLYCSFYVNRDFMLPMEEKLWAFDTVLETWKHVCTRDLHAQNPLGTAVPAEHEFRMVSYRAQNPLGTAISVDHDFRMSSYRYVVCLGKLLAIAQYTSFLHHAHSVVIYEYSAGSADGCGVGSWTELSAMPKEFTGNFWRRSRQHPVVNQFVYFGPVPVWEDESLLVLLYNLYQRSWMVLKSVPIPENNTHSGTKLRPMYSFSMTPNRDAIP